MRLTLRTLLAYMDDTLDPVHAREIGQKINESPTASKLMGRTRDVMRRRRLTAPKLTGPGAGLDVNTVAEYLDNTAAPERVPDIEKVCLESDMHLAEVGACHQILTLVLGEPAEIDPESRRRMYSLVASEQSPAGVAAALAEPEPTHAAPSPAMGRSFAETMPGYLRQPPWWKQAVPVGVVVVSLALVALLFFMIVGGDRTPTSVAQRPTASDVETVEEIAPVEPAAQPAEEPTAADESPSPETAAEPAEPDDADSEPETQSTTPAPPTPTPAVTVPDVAAPVTATVTPSGTVPEPKVEPAPARREVAQFTSTSGLLLNHVAKANEWTRLPSRALIYSGDSILVPPLYRARFSLGTGGELDVAGATSLELLSPPADAGLAFRLHFGRFVLRDLPVGTAVLVKLDEESWEFRVSSGGSVLAFEAVARMPQGFESTLSNPRYDMRLVVPQGQVSWQGGQGTIEQSSVLTLLSSEGELGADPVVAPLGDAPAWIEGEELGILDQNASRRLQDETLVPFDKDVSLPLIEATQDRRQEVRTLATGTLGAMGNYSALFEALTYSDAEVRREAVVWLRRWLARSGEHVAAVRGEIDRFRPGQGGKNLDRLLWGYTDRDLQDGGAEELINSLENDDLPIRELALFNLEEITGRTLNFQPDSPPLQRDRSVRQWRQLLEDGKLLARQRGRI